jgi:hypothetical protein
MILYREWYGSKGPNEGLKLPTAEVAKGILQRERGEKIDVRVADPACWKADGGPSHAEVFANNGVVFRRADNSRISGWNMMRDRLLGIDGKPMAYVFGTAVDFIRTVPVIQHDNLRPEDVDTDGEDHCFAADTIVATPEGPRRISELPPEGEVMGPFGPVEYRSGGLRLRQTETVKATFADGSAIVCTPDHQFLTADGTWKPARNLAGRLVMRADWRGNHDLRGLWGSMLDAINPENPATIRFVLGGILLTIILPLTRCIEVTPHERADVYCVTVPSIGAFTLGNGMIVANSADAARYGFMARPWTRSPAVVLPMRSAAQMTMDEAWKLARPPQRREGRI